MALRQTLNETARVVRRVLVDEAMAPLLADIPESWLPARFVESLDDMPTDAESPRDYPPLTLSYVGGFKSLDAGEPLRAGTRVERWQDDVYELLSDPKPVHAGRIREGWSVRVQRTSVLYPVSATVEAQGGAVLQESMPCAIWGGSGHKGSAGEYEDRDGEAPIEFADVLATNTQLHVGPLKLRVLDATVDLVGPRVKLRLRAPRG